MHTATNVTINNDYTCPPDSTTGQVDCGNWEPTYTIPGSALTTSGVYLAGCTAFNGHENAVSVFVVRDDGSHVADPLHAADGDLPGLQRLGRQVAVLRHRRRREHRLRHRPRAVKVSFDRPLDDPRQRATGFLGPDFYLVQWLEQQGYDISYTDDVSRQRRTRRSCSDHNIVMHLRPLRVLVRRADATAFKAARDAGVNIASFSGNTAYWKVRYEDGGRTLVCYKTVEGAGSTGSGADGAERLGARTGSRAPPTTRWASTAIAGTADDNPQNATTTCARQRRAHRRPERAARWPRRPRHAGEPAVRRSCTSATTTPATTR